MAKRHKRRHYHDVVGVALNGLGLSGSVDAKDVVTGMGAGVAGGAVVKGLYNNVAAVKGIVPPMLTPYLFEIGAVLAAAGAYFVQKKSHPGRAKAHLIGAGGLAVASVGWKLLQSTLPQYFAGVISVRLNGHDYGVMVDDSSTPLGGLITDDSSGTLGYSSSDSNLAELAAASMGDDTDDPFVDALEMLGAA